MLNRQVVNRQVVCPFLLISLTFVSTSPAAPRPAWTTSTVRGTPEPPSPYKLVQDFGGISFYAPTFVEQIPRTDTYLVGELCGRIFAINRHTSRAKPELVVDFWPDLPNRPGFPAPGQPPLRTNNPLPAENLFEFAFHPDFETNRFVFLSYVGPGTEGDVRVSRFELTDETPPRLARDTETKIINWHNVGHGGGCMRFGGDGYLYIATGDGVGPNPPDSNDAGQDISNLMASILRLDVDNPDGDRPYSIPSDNPFVKTPGARPEVWAYGLRHAWRMDFDHATGDLWLGDVGWETWEMVHRVFAGGNYGWSIMEGPTPLRLEVTPGPTPITPAVKAYPRVEANSITGGIVYTGTKHKELVGSFVYGDYRTGKIWAIDTRASGDYQDHELARTSVRIVDFSQDSHGDVHVLDHDNTGRIYKLVKSREIGLSDEFPRRLSETGLFASTAGLRPANGVVPYEVVAEPWMDGATAQRMVALPGQSSIQCVTSGGSEKWHFPDGTVFVKTISKTFGQEAERLETQLLHLENETWRAYTYSWNDAQDDADLVDSSGLERTICGDDSASSVQDGSGFDPNWRHASRTECVFCHRPAVGTVLGFTPAQLNRDVEDGESAHNQLEVLAHARVFTGDPLPALEPSSALVDPYETTADLSDRARSYLDVNCGICHNPNGESISMFYLKRHYSIEDAMMLKKAGIGTFGMDDPQLVTPGEPYRSVLLYRVGKLGFARMPYIGSRQVDSAGFTLLRDWIASMKSHGAAQDSHLTAQAGTLTSDNASEAAREEAIGKLLETTSGAVALVALIHQDSLTAATKEKAVELGQLSSSANLRTLFDTFIPPSQRRRTLGPNIQPDALLTVVGDAARGKVTYMSDSSRCATCHVPDQEGNLLGPDLPQIVKKKYTKTELLQHILQPSLKIDPEFTVYSVLAEDGRVLTGVIVEETDTELVLKDVEKKVIRITKKDDDERQTLPKSIMPEGLLADMTAQEAADLLAYLASLPAE